MNWLEESYQRRKPLINQTNVFRALHRGEVDNVDLSVDIYDRYFCAMIYGGTLPQDLIKKIAEQYGCKGGIIKFPQKDPHNVGWVRETEFFGEKPPAWFEVTENGLKFRVTLTEKQHTGLFLDQRDNRAWVKESSRDKVVANLFSYTCSFSVAAAVGGAKNIHSVDISKPFLDWGRENFAQNHVATTGHFFFADDVRDWLDRRIKNIGKGKDPKFDIVICDPPTFAQGFKIEKEWPNLCSGIAKILNSDGVAVFSNNQQERPDRFFKNHLSNYFLIQEVPTQIDFAGTFHARYFKARLA